MLLLDERNTDKKASVIVFFFTRNYNGLNCNSLQ